MIISRNIYFDGVAFDLTVLEISKKDTCIKMIQFHRSHSQKVAKFKILKKVHILSLMWLFSRLV